MPTIPTACQFAALLLGESLDATEMVGGGLILAGCLSNAVLPPDFLTGATAGETAGSRPTDEARAADGEGRVAEAERRGGRLVLPKKVAELRERVTVE
jgi:hypothetical protein